MTFTNAETGLQVVLDPMGDLLCIYLLDGNNASASVRVRGSEVNEMLIMLKRENK